MSILYIVGSEGRRDARAEKGERVESRQAFEERLARAFLPEVVFATPNEARIALETGLSKVAWSDALFGPIWKSGGEGWRRTVDVVDEAMEALFAANVSAATLTKLGRGDSTLGKRARALAMAMEAQEFALRHAKLVDVRTRGRRLSEALCMCSPEDVVAEVGGPRVRAEWILDWQPREIAWWKELDAKLSRAGGGAEIVLPLVPSAISAESRGPMDVVFDELLKALDAPPATQEIESPLGDLSFATDPGSPDRVSVCAAASLEGEARAVVASVREALLGGVPLEKVAVVMVKPEDAFVRSLVRLLEDAEIPVFDPNERSRSESGVVALAFRLLEGDLHRHNVAGILRSQYIDPKLLCPGATREEARRALLDLADTLERAPQPSGLDAKERLVSSARSNPFGREEDRRRRIDVTQHLLRVMENRVSGTRGEHVQALRALLAAFGVPRNAALGGRATLQTDEPIRGVDRFVLNALAKDASAWQHFERALLAYELSVLRLSVGDENISRDTFTFELRRFVEGEGRLPGAGRAAALRLVSFQELAGEASELLVVSGAREGALPFEPPKHGLLSTSLIEKLSNSHTSLGALAPEAHSNIEMANLLLATANATHVTFTYATIDETGAPQSASALVDWLERSGVKVTAWPASPVLPNPMTAREWRLGNLATVPGTASRVLPESARRALVEERREGFFLDPKRTPSEWVGDLSAHEGSLGSIRADIASAERPLPVTTLEKLASCAFRGFALQALGARELALDQETPDAREEGTLLHEALHVTVSSVIELLRERPRDPESIGAKASRTLDRFFAEKKLGGALRDVMEARVRDAVAAVLAWTIRDDMWNVFATEQPFGDASAESWPAYTLGEGAETVSLRGKIDRVDVSVDRLSVRAVDYKRSVSSTKVSPRDLGTTNLQVPVYALAAKRAGSASRAEGLYLPVLAKDLPPEHRVADSFRDALANLLAGGADEPALVERTVTALVQAVRSGNVMPIPSAETVCRLCHLDGACRRPRFAIKMDDETEDE